MNRYDDAIRVPVERFGCGMFLSLAAIDDDCPAVRIVNSYYEERAFHAVTYWLSNKMKRIGHNSAVAVCGEWFTAHGIGENIGHPCGERNKEQNEYGKI